ncbi:MAG: hypothetical protein ACWGO1_13090 [Anaerolineales bacterium]
MDNGSLPLAFELWEMAPASEEQSLSFGLQGDDSEQVALWEIDLPPDSEAAGVVLQRRAEFIQSSLAALEDAPDEIGRFVQKVGGVPLSEVSYGALPEQPLSEAEQDALRMLTYLEVGPQEVSFTTAEQSREDLEQASQQFQSAFERMLRLVSHFAWVETRIGGSLSGRTIVGWSGDMDNLWADQLEEDGYKLHQQSVQQALASRNILVHACVATAQSAGKLAVLLTNPAGAIFALPVAWKLVSQILEDIEKYRNITNQEMSHAE